jgi:O-antigen ligase
VARGEVRGEPLEFESAERNVMGLRSYKINSLTLTSVAQKRQIRFDASSWQWLGVALIAVGLAGLTAYLAASGNLVVTGALLVAPVAFLLLHRYPWLALLGWYLFLPFFTVTTTSLDRQVYWMVHRFLPPLTLLAMWLSVMLKMYGRKFPKLGWVEFFMGAYVFVSLITIFFFDDAPLSTFYVFYDRVISPMLIYVIIRWWNPNAAEIRRLLPVILFLVISQLTIGLISWFAPSLLPWQWLEWAGQRTTGSLRSYGAYAAAMVFGAVFLLHEAVHSSSVAKRFIYYSAFVLALFGDFLSFSRAAWIAGGLVLTGLFFLYRRPLFRLGLIITPVLILLFSGPLSAQIAWAQERLYSAESQESALSRLPVYLASVRMLAARPLFGWGYENFNDYDWQFYGRVGDLTGVIKDRSSHNFYLTLLAEQGLVGFSLFMLPLVVLAIRSLKALPQLPARGFWSKKLVAIVWLYLLGYFVINSFQSMKIVFILGLWWVSLALLAIISERSSQPIPGKR